MDYLQHAVDRIQERNRKVEADKAWEVSMTRRGCIAITTYATAVLFLWLIGNANFWLTALVPTGGYLLSTLTLPTLKRWWLSRL